MSRLRARTLVLVNWKGVFYEKFDLDPGVTALEGANGAGKTTVMIAAYVVLMPDMGRLRFTNLGEGGAVGGDRGIYGRLGEPGRPSYAVLDLQHPDGSRLLAGVHLERRGEPTVELTPFLVTDLPGDAALQDVFLERGQVDEVPDRRSLRDLVARQGGRIKFYSTTREYFHDLFDLGLTPLRLAREEERAKFSEMLRTSMVGGISRTLTGSLRDFLLKEETGLADTLQRMRENLDACHRTRLEVGEARRLEAEISSVYEAGQAMFAFALQATRAEAREAWDRLQAAREALRCALAERDQVRRERDEAAARLDEAEKRQAWERQELERLRILRDGTRQAHRIHERMLERERDQDELARQEAEARQALEAADRKLSARERDHRQALSDYQSALAGSADSRKAVQELDRRAAFFQEVTARLGDLPPERLEAEPSCLEARLADLDRETVDLDRNLSTAELRRREHAKVLRALESLNPPPGEGAESVEAGPDGPPNAATGGGFRGPLAPSAGDPYERGRRALEDLRRLEATAASEADLARRLPQLRREAEAQERARALAARLDLEADDLNPPPCVGEGGSPLQPKPGEVGTVSRRSRSGSEGSATGPKPRLEAATGGEPRADRVASEVEAADSASETLARERERLGREAAEAGQRAADAEARAASLEIRLARWTALSAEAAHLSRVWDCPLADREDLDALVGRLQEERDGELAAQRALESRVEALEADLRRLRQSGGLFPEALLQARDAVEGELLAGRFEDLSLEDAPRVQARLGPLADALVVEDRRAAAQVLTSRDGVPDTVWLVDAGSVMDLSREARSKVSEEHGHALVAGEKAWRLTRWPEVAALGRRSRDRLRQELHEALERNRDRVEDRRARLRRLDEAVRDVQVLLPEVAVLEEGDPGPTLEEARQQASRERTRQEELQAEMSAAAARAEAWAERRRALVELLPRAWLLDRDDLRGALARLEATLAEARRAAERLQATREAREVLSAGLEALRLPPPDEREVERLEARRGQVAEEARGLATRLRDLRFVVEFRHALEWSDAPRALAEHQDLLPALKAEEEHSRAAEEKARGAAEEARGSRNAAERAHLREAARLESLQEELQRLREDLGTTGCPDPSAEALRDVQQRWSEVETRLQDLARAADSLRATRAALDERLRAREAASAAREGEVSEAEVARRPREDRLANLEARAGEHGALVPALASPARDRDSGWLWQEAVKARTRLAERLEHSHEAGTVREAVRGLGDERRPEPCLAAWLATREWLRRRVPPSIAETDEPLEALGRLREHLERLEGRLALQERDLRGQSSDIARNIETQVRRSRRQVEALNQDLREVRFGSIRSVQLKVQPVDRMWNVLEALKESQAQGLLFDAEVPIEEALEELFRRHGGGRTGGSRLLDYREYIELKVEVQRTSGSAWEEANPTRMSTGEAIGVGAAVMIVVLTAWERDARLFRTARSGGTLRLLFLDEANRLSQDSLSVLFELCQNLDLQLLIAAPEVARAEGNTTYRLVRRVDDEGREEVLVSGRRARALVPPAPAALGAGALP